MKKKTGKNETKNKRKKGEAKRDEKASRWRERENRSLLAFTIIFRCTQTVRQSNSLLFTLTSTYRALAHAHTHVRLYGYARSKWVVKLVYHVYYCWHFPHFFYSRANPSHHTHTHRHSHCQISFQLHLNVSNFFLFVYKNGAHIQAM